MPDLFSPNGNRLTVEVGANYDPGITKEIDKAIRHLPIVMATMNFYAEKLKNTVGSNFMLVTQNNADTQRPRVYVVPKNSNGIREELGKSVLLKAALGMAAQ